MLRLEIWNLLGAGYGMQVILDEMDYRLFSGRGYGKSEIRTFDMGQNGDQWG